MIEWLCPACRYVWEATGNTRAQGCGCRACAGKAIKPDGSNSIAATPYGKEFRYLVGNPAATAANTVAGTSRMLGWECSECSHQWKASGTNREHGGCGCPKCNRTYSASEHLSNNYLKTLLNAEAFRVEVEPGCASKVTNPEGRPFQVDARIHTNDGLIAYLYDGLRGHLDEETSRETDTLRRKKLCKNVAFVVAHRHGMLGIEKEVAASNYVEVITDIKSSVLAGAMQVIQSLCSDLLTSQIDFESIFETARVSWNAMPKANSLKFESVLKREKKALIIEGYLPSPIPAGI
jgi:ssDNA-binding Zn-finger/Zn-ribbon topoisomerase 1